MSAPDGSPYAGATRFFGSRSVTTKRQADGTWHAYLDGDRRRWESAGTEAEAIGKLVVTWSAEGRDPWPAASDPGLPVAERAAALGELACVDDPALPAWLADEMERAEAGGEWQRMLVAAAEQSSLRGAEARRRLTGSLLAAARAQTGPARWSAMRRHASIVDASRAGSLAEFLAPGCDDKTVQAALQCVVNIFELDPPGAEGARDELAAAVRAQADARLAPGPERTPEEAAVAYNCVVALAALRDPAAAGALRLFEALGHRRLAERTREYLAARGVGP